MSSGVSDVTSRSIDRESSDVSMKSEMAPRNIILPEWTTATLVQSDSTSDMMWEDMIIVPPSSMKRRKSERKWTTPAGSIPIMGSSRIEQGRISHHRLGHAEPLDHALA